MSAHPATSFYHSLHAFSMCMFNSESTYIIHGLAEGVSRPRVIPRRSNSGCDFALKAFGCIIRIKLIPFRHSWYPVYTARHVIQSGVIFTSDLNILSLFLTHWLKFKSWDSDLDNTFICSCTLNYHTIRLKTLYQTKTKHTVFILKIPRGVASHES